MCPRVRSERYAVYRSQPNPPDSVPLLVWISLADGDAGLGGMIVQAHCLSGSSHYPPTQPPAQLSPMLTELGMASVRTVVLLSVIL